MLATERKRQAASNAKEKTPVARVLKSAADRANEPQWLKNQKQKARIAAANKGAAKQIDNLFKEAEDEQQEDAVASYIFLLIPLPIRKRMSDLTANAAKSVSSVSVKSETHPKAAVAAASAGKKRARRTPP